MGPLEVSLFGGFQLRRGEETVPPIPSRAARALLAYLAVHRGVQQPRERLAGLFWPDLPANRARRRLSHSLWQVQDALGELSGDVSYLDVAADSIAFEREAACRVDVEEFEDGLDRARGRRGAREARIRDLTDLERTVALYRGEFLAGHQEPWVETEQERLHQRYLEALGWLVGLAKVHGSYDDALVYARRLTNEDPLREDGHREVMRLLVLLGRPADAIRQFERVREVLGEELGTEPSPATVDLHRRILRQRGLAGPAPPEPGPMPERVPLIGRDRERDLAITVLERGLAGRGGAVLVEGEAGVGTTRLLAELIDDAEWRSFATSGARGRAPESTLPYGVVQELLDGSLTPLRIEQLRPRVAPVWLVEAARLVPALARAVSRTSPVAAGDLSSRDGAQRMRDALVEVVLALAAIDPLLFVVDDLHHADFESLEVLRALGGRLPEHRLVLLLGYRGEEARRREDVWAALRDIDRTGRPERLVLGPLDAFSTAELVRLLGRGRTVGPAAVTRLLHETGGNPRFLVETLRVLSDEQLLGVLADDDAHQLPLPRSIRASVLSRVERLAPTQRGLLDLVAVAGDRVDLETLVLASEQPREVVVDAADQLVRRSLVSQGEESFGLGHDQIRRVVIDALGLPTLAALHRRVGDALRELHPNAVERLAHHYAEAGAPRLAVDYLRRSGRSAARVHAYTTADRYYRRAVHQLSLAPADVRTRFEILAEHEAVLEVLGDRQGQREALEELKVLADGDPEREVEVARRRAVLAGHVGRMREGVAAAEHAVEVARRLGAPDLLARSLVAHASVLTWSGRRPDAVGVLEQAIEHGADVDIGIRARAQLGSVLRELQHYGRAVEVLEEVLELAGAHGAPTEEANALGALGTVRMETGESDAAIELYGRAIERAEAIGFRRAVGVSRLNRANARYVSGELAAALDDYRAAAATFAALDDRRGESAALANEATVLHGVFGADAVAREKAERALAYFSEIGDTSLGAHCHDTLAGIALREGDHERARRHLDTALGELPPGTDAWSRSQLLRRSSQVALGSGEAEAARELAADAEREALGHGLADLVPAAAGLRGEALLALGHVQDALRSTTAALRALHPGVERRELVRFQHALALSAAGREQEADQEVERALGELDELLRGAEPADREAALAVPEHRRIADWHARSRRDRRRLAIASVEAPLGRPVASGELVEVVVDVGSRDGDPVDPVERRRAVLCRVATEAHEQGGSPTVQDLATMLDVSPATVRRDLEALRSGGVAVHTRGRRREVSARFA